MVKQEVPFGGILWKATALMAIPAITMAAGLWRDVALHSNEIVQLRAELAANQSAIREHLTSDRARLDAAATAEKEQAVDRARLGAAMENLKGQIDALLASLSHRRPK